MSAKRVGITVYPEELEILQNRARKQGLPLSRYLVMKALGRLNERGE